MIEPSTILDLNKITNIVDSYKQIDNMMWKIREDLINHSLGNYWFLYDDCVLMFERVNVTTWQVHIYSSTSKNRGSTLRDFAIECGRWVLDNTTCENIICFVSEKKKFIQFFMRMLDFTEYIQISQNERMYYLNRDKLEGRLKKWH